MIYICNYMKRFYCPLFLLLLITSCGHQKGDGNNGSSDTASVDLQTLNKKILDDPNNAELYHQRSKYHFNNKDLNAAAADMNRVMKLDSNNASYYLTLSEIYFTGNKTSKAKEALEKCISIDTANTEALMKLGELFLYVKKYEESIKCINKVLRKEPYHSKAYLIKGMNYAEKGDTNLAVSSMQTAVEQNPDYNSYILLANILAAKKEKLALDYYNNALKLQPKSTEALYDKAKFFQDIKMLPEAIATYQQLLGIDPEYAEAHYNLGAIDLLANKDFKSALNHFDDAIKSNGNYATAYFARGTCYKMTGNIPQAEKDFETAARLGSEQ